MDAWNAAHAPKIVQPAPSRSPRESAAHPISSRPGSKARKQQVVAVIKKQIDRILLQGSGHLYLLRVASCAAKVRPIRHPQSQIPNRNNPKSRTSVICHLSSDLCSLSSVICLLPSVICHLSSVIRQPVPGRLGLGCPVIPFRPGFSSRRRWCTAQPRNSLLQGGVGRKQAHQAASR